MSKTSQLENHPDLIVLPKTQTNLNTAIMWPMMDIIARPLWATLLSKTIPVALPLLYRWLTCLPSVILLRFFWPGESRNYLGVLKTLTHWRTHHMSYDDCDNEILSLTREWRGFVLQTRDHHWSVKSPAYFPPWPNFLEIAVSFATRPKLYPTMCLLRHSVVKKTLSTELYVLFHSVWYRMTPVLYQATRYIKLRDGIRMHHRLSNHLLRHIATGTVLKTTFESNVAYLHLQKLEFSINCIVPSMPPHQATREVSIPTNRFSSVWCIRRSSTRKLWPSLLHIAVISYYQ